MITIKTSQEINILREGGKRLAQIRDTIADMVQIGMSPQELNRRAERLIFDAGGAPSFKGYKGKNEKSFPASICVSINDELVHAPPRHGVFFREGDVVGIDIGMWWPGEKEFRTWNLELGKNQSPHFSKFQTPSSKFTPLCTDTAVTVGVGKISKDAKRLLRGTREALQIGIRAVKPGRTIGDIGHAVETHLKKYHLGIVRKLAGHGVGYQVHEEPLIPNYGKPGTGAMLKKGMVIAIEPMATLGADDIITGDDGWTIVSQDRSLTAHFEHTIAVLEYGAAILTHFDQTFLI